MLPRLFASHARTVQVTITRFVAALAFALAASGASAQAYPDRPIRVIVPVVAGGSTDLVGIRAVASEIRTEKK
jgi:tripartite-type tricarboxylate transporter receptor subunit TctC